MPLQRSTRTEKALDQDRSHLRDVAIEAYVTGGASQSLSVVFNGSQQTAGMQQAYIQAASGNLDESETTVLINQRALSLERATLDRTEQIARANETAISTDLTQEVAVTAQLNNEQAQVKGAARGGGRGGSTGSGCGLSLRPWHKPPPARRLRRLLPSNRLPRLLRLPRLPRRKPPPPLRPQLRLRSPLLRRSQATAPDRSP